MPCIASDLAPDSRAKRARAVAEWRSPLSAEHKPGLRIPLHTDHLGGLDTGDPVFFRDIHVGDVVRRELSKDGKTVDVQVVIRSSHAHLVRSNSVFWNASGISADLGLHGLHVHAESLKVLLSGGVAFATPPKPGHMVSAGPVFKLHAEAKDDWRKWEIDYSAKDGDGDGENKPGIIGRFFRQEDKTEEETLEHELLEQEKPTPEERAISVIDPGG